MIRKKYQVGFTIPELMIGIALFAIIVSYAVPSFQNLMRRQELNSKLGQLKTTLAYARTEAVSRAKSVIVCPANESESACISSDDWSGSWLVFVDEDDDNAQGTADELLRITGDFGRQIQLSADSKDPIIYNDVGESAASRDLKMCIPGAGSDANNSRTISISNVGSTRVTKGGGC